MKILVVTNLFHPDRGGGASVFSDMCYGLVERGHDVTVFSTYPYYPEWQNKSGAKAWRTATETINGVRVARFGVYIPTNPSKFIPRVMFELSFTLSLMRSLFYFRRYDAVMVYCPVLSSVLYGAIRRIFYREPMWLNVQDIPADAAAAAGISKNRFANRLSQMAQKFLFNRAVLWSSIAPKMIQRLSELRTRNQPIHLVPNFLNTSMAEVIAAHAPKINRPVSQPIKLLYGGNIGKKQGLLEFCKQLSKSKLAFQFTIHGNGGEAPSLKQWVEASGDSRFRFGEFLDEAGFVNALFESDLFVITEKSGAGASFIPSKLIPCMATGTPVLCVCDPDGPLGTEVGQYGLGVTSHWNELDELLDRLTELSHDQQRYRQLQQNAIERSEAYRRDPVIDFVERELTLLTQKK